jgi:hypothetical protein
VERFDLKKLYSIEVKGKYQVRMLNGFVALDNFDETMVINRESIRENMKTSATEGLDNCKLKWHKPWFDKKNSKLLDQRKAKLQ